MNTNRWLTPTRRRWIYGMSIAGFGVLTVYGLMDADQVAAWSAFAMAVCGLAFDNVQDEPGDSHVPEHASDDPSD